MSEQNPPLDERGRAVRNSSDRAAKNVVPVSPPEDLVRHRPVPRAELQSEEARVVPGLCEVATVEPGESVHGERANFTGLVIGVIEADLCN